MPFDEKGFAADIVKHLGLLRNDMQTLKSLRAKDRKGVMKRVLNLLIDIKNMPEFVEALLFSFVVEYMEHFVKSKLGGE